MTDINHIIKTLRDTAKDNLGKAAGAAEAVVLHKRHLARAQAEFADYTARADAAEQAIRDIEAADRRRAIYGREVLQ